MKYDILSNGVVVKAGTYKAFDTALTDTLLETYISAAELIDLRDGEIEFAVKMIAVSGTQLLNCIAVEITEISAEQYLDATIPIDGGAKDDGSGTITGSANAVIKRPHYILEDLLRNRLSIAAGSLNTDDKTALTTLFTNWVFELSLTEQKLSLEYIKDLLRNTGDGMRYHVDPVGKYHWYKIGETSDTAVFTFKEKETILEYLVRADGTRDEILPTLTLSPIDDLISEVTVRYDFNPARKQVSFNTRTEGAVAFIAREGFQKSYVLGSASDQDLSDAKTLYNVTRAAVIEAEWIRDSVTAQELRHRIKTQRSKQKWIMRFPTTWDAITLASDGAKTIIMVGDICAITYDFARIGLDGIKWSAQKTQVLDLELVPDELIWVTVEEALAAPDTRIVTDAFTRADSTTTLGSADTLQSWTAHQGTWGISSNKAYVATTGGVDDTATVNSGFSNIDVQADCQNEAQRIGLVFRMKDIQNRWYFFYHDGTGKYNLGKVINGIFTTVVDLTEAWALGTTKTLKVTANGTSIECFVDGVSKLTASSQTDMQYETKHGLYSYNTILNRHDNFQIDKK